ncbi:MULTISPECIES: hypothetical protein [unclassified Streptomyces]|uniref:hypothetical protein n=1 Tax=unclassified Streptomyces TaxID=2593676 RepID=UPI0038699284|nr:hypothetical protein OG569_40660 [Streptomyces sp. NBC_00827]
MTSTSSDLRILPFLEISAAGYPGRFLELGVEQEELPGGGVTLYGRCPRCEASLRIPLPLDLVKSAPQSPPADGADDPEPLVAIVCTCSTCEHAGRPAQYDNGCGAYWVLDVAKEEG